jgi:hypothetical protein
MYVMLKGTHHREESKELLRQYYGEKNSQFGKPKSEEVKQKIREAVSGEKNGSWKGNKVKMPSLHEWIRNHKPKPKFCEKCKKEKPFEVANISGKYKRDINDFKWLCRRCHMKGDGRIDKGKKRLKLSSVSKIKEIIKHNKRNNIKCPLCNSFCIVKRGLIENKKQRFGCKNCSIRFS